MAEPLPETGEAASRVEVSGSIAQINDHFYHQGWTDGHQVESRWMNPNRDWK